MPRGNLRTSYNNKILNLKGCLFQMFHMKSWAATTLMLATKQWKSLKFNSQWEQTASLIKMGLLLIFKLVLQVILETFLASWHICKVSLVPEKAFIASFNIILISIIAVLRIIVVFVDLCLWVFTVLQVFLWP